MGIIADAQLIGKALQEAGKIELYQKLIEIQEKIVEIQEENQRLREVNQGLSTQLSIQLSLRFEHNAYYRDPGSGSSTPDGPFCSRCWDREGKLMRMHSEDVGGYFRCPYCKTLGAKVISRI